MVNSSLHHASEKSPPDGTASSCGRGGSVRSRVLVAGHCRRSLGLVRHEGSAGQAPGSEATFRVPPSTYTPPKTPWGDPDLQGVWDNHTVVPMQRPANLAGKKTFTDAELAARRRLGRATSHCATRTTNGAPTPPLPISTSSVPTTASGRRRISCTTTGPRSSRIRRTDDCRR